ncbi:hypothetical protein [Nocardiopsis dassonvillei]|uniref:hypothetical protein n=1 Tax=Nocardiopsis dassonvillei TaxID=2014 RepID=UPI003630D9E3
MSADPLRQELEALARIAASIRFGQLAADRERTGAAACGHTITTAPASPGIPAAATCLLAEGHRGRHEDEYARLWDAAGSVTYREG